MTLPLNISPRHHRLGSRAAAGGFTLLELLMAVALGSLVLGALGGSLLVSQMRVSTRIRQDLERKDALNRAITLMRWEINQASSISSSQKGGAVWNLCASPSLRISTPGMQDTCYKVTTSAQAINNGYPGSTDRPWKGSCVLMRQGANFDPNSGQLNAATSSGQSQIFQVILDDLASGCGTGAFNFSISPSASSGQPASRNVSITITQSNGSSTTFNANTGSNPLFSGNENTPSTCQSTDSVCHWRIPPVPTSPDPNQKNIYYLNTPYDPNSSTSNCTYDSCIVSSGSNSYTLKYVDVLVFADREIRP